jgi:hypothetical protein
MSNLACTLGEVYVERNKFVHVIFEVPLHS